MGNKCSKPKATQNAAVAAVSNAQGASPALPYGHGSSYGLPSVGTTAMPFSPHVELRSEIEHICELYDSFVTSKTRNAAAPSTSVQIDFDELYLHKGNSAHATVARVVAMAPSVVPGQRCVDAFADLKKRKQPTHVLTWGILRYTD